LYPFIEKKMTSISPDMLSIDPPQNLASRCRSFVLRTLEKTTSNVDVAFAHALGITSYDSADPDHKDLVRASITSMRRQQSILIEKLGQNLTITPDLYQEIVAANRELSAMSNLDQSFQNFPTILGSAYQLALGWAAHSITNTGDTVNAQQVSEILSDIVGLKARLAAVKFPTEVREFIEQLLKELENGIVTSCFEGSNALQRTCRNAVGEISAAEDHLRSTQPNLNAEQLAYLNETAKNIHETGKLAGGKAATIDFIKKIVPVLTSTET
jgi:hypothetical protein